MLELISETQQSSENISKIVVEDLSLSNQINGLLENITLNIALLDNKFTNASISSRLDELQTNYGETHQFCVFRDTSMFVFFSLFFFASKFLLEYYGTDMLFVLPLLTQKKTVLHSAFIKFLSYKVRTLHFFPVVIYQSTGNISKIVIEDLSITNQMNWLLENITSNIASLDNKFTNASIASRLNELQIHYGKTAILAFSWLHFFLQCFVAYCS